MKHSRLSDEQIVTVLREWDAGAKVADLVRRHGVTEQTLYRWKKKYGGMQVGDATRCKAGGAGSASPCLGCRCPSLPSATSGTGS